MRICITRSTRYGYSETFIKDQISGFSKWAEVFTIHSGRLPERKEDGALLGPWLFWILHKMIKGISGKRNNYFGNYGLKKYLRTNNIDVVLANYGLSGTHLAPVCCDLNIPLLVIFHGHDATDKKLLKEYAHKYKALFTYASFLIAVSQDIRRGLIKLGADPEKIKVVPCGVDVLKFKPSLSQKEDIFLAVGRFVKKKGPLYTLQAFHQVWKKYPSAKLIMVGGKSGLYSACRSMAVALGMEQSVVFAGVLKHEKVSVLMEKALAFVQHSITASNGDTEGTPVSILEASASGLPVISTFHGGIRDAVIHNKTGFLVEEGDVEGMAGYMMKILEDRSLAITLGQEGRQHIEVHYHQDKQIEKLNVLAMEAVGRGNS